MPKIIGLCEKTKLGKAKILVKKYIIDIKRKLLIYNFINKINFLK